MDLLARLRSGVVKVVYVNVPGVGWWARYKLVQWVRDSI